MEAGNVLRRGILKKTGKGAAQWKTLTVNSTDCQSLLFHLGRYLFSTTIWEVTVPLISCDIHLMWMEQYVILFNLQEVAVSGILLNSSKSRIRLYNSSQAVGAS
ncbi:hypothetical protein ACET3Z_004035 [Daucus carota]